MATTGLHGHALGRICWRAAAAGVITHSKMARGSSSRSSAPDRLQRNRLSLAPSGVAPLRSGLGAAEAGSRQAVLQSLRREQGAHSGIGRAGAADNFQKTAHIPKRVLKMGAGAEAAHAGVPGDPAIPGLRSGGLLHLRSQWQHAANFRTENLLNTAGIMGAMGRVVRGQPVVR